MSNKSQLDIALENLNDFAEDNIKLREKNKRLQAEIEELKKHQCSFENCDNFERYSTEIHELKQENERLKEKLRTEKIYSSQIEELEESLQHAKTENERLKEQYNCYACDSCGGKEDYINMKRHTENAIKTVHKYRQALQEIRDMAKEGSKSVFADEDCDKILTKINEVIGV